MMKLSWTKLKVSIYIYHLGRRFSSTLGFADSILILHGKLKDMVSKGIHPQALRFYRDELHPTGLHDNAFILPTVLKACSSFQYHNFGLQLHCIAIKSSLDFDPVVSNSFISFYAKISDALFAFKVFDTMPLRDSISWHSIVNCYLQNEYFSKAFELFKEMYRCGFVPKAELIASVISVSVRSGYMKLGLGRVLHALVTVDERIEEEVFVLTSLVDWYFKSGDSSRAFRVFDAMDVKSVASWTAVVSGCTANLDYDMAIDCLRAMQINGVRPNRVTLIAILRACAELGCFKQGKEIHGYAFHHGFDSDPHFSSSLIHLLCKSAEGLKLAKLIFERSTVKDVVMFSSIIGTCSHCGDSMRALKLFNQMRAEGIQPNYVTLLAVINACTKLAALKHGNGTHCYVMKSGLNFDVLIGNALINMYSKCCCLASSRYIFNEMPVKDSVSWSTLVTGYGLHGYGEEALCLFHEMQARGLEPDAITLLAVLSACNHAGLVKEGQQIFNNVQRDGRIPLTTEHYACQIDLLGKSGKIDDAFDILRTMPMTPSTTIWSSLVSACKTHGRWEIAKLLASHVIKLEPENAANHTLLCMIYAESGNWNGVDEVRRLLRAQGLNKCHGFSQISVEC